MTQTAELPTVVVIVATFNSGRRLGPLFETLERQTYPRDRLLCLIVDGGSTDDTREIARRFGATVIDNPRTEPVYAKFLALHATSASLGLYLDHDELMADARSIERKVDAMSAAAVHAVVGSGYANGPGRARINDYINDFGDPFSAFMYRLSKHHRRFTQTMRRHYRVVEETPDWLVIDFSGTRRLPIIELCAGGSMIDLDYVRDELADAVAAPEDIPHLFYRMLPASPRLAVMRDDVLVHDSADTLRSYLSKIRWRIKNNVHFPEMASSGFTGRAAFASPWFRLKRFLFVPYSLSIVLPAVDGVVMGVQRRNPVYLLHPALCLYTTALVVGHMTLRAAGWKPRLRSYDESTVVSAPTNGTSASSNRLGQSKRSA